MMIRFNKRLASFLILSLIVGLIASCKKEKYQSNVPGTYFCDYYEVLDYDTIYADTREVIITKGAEENEILLLGITTHVDPSGNFNICELSNIPKGCYGRFYDPDSISMGYYIGDDISGTWYYYQGFKF